MPSPKAPKPKRSVATTAFLVAVFLVGLGLLLYPTLSDWWNTLHQTRVIAGYTEQVASMSDADRQKLLEEARVYNGTLVNKAGRFILTDEELAEYETYLSVPNTNVIAYIDIPKINCYLPIYHGTDEAVLQEGVGHLEGSSLPVGGESTHCVVTGHRGLPSAKLFTDLDQLEVGDTFTIHVLDETLGYEVDQICVVEPDDTSELKIFEGEDYCTLITCTPYGINTHRLLVRGHRVEIAEAEAARAQDGGGQIDSAVAAALAVVSVLALALGCFVLKRNKAAKRKEL